MWTKFTAKLLTTTVLPAALWRAVASASRRSFLFMRMDQSLGCTHTPVQRMPSARATLPITNPRPHIHAACQVLRLHTPRCNCCQHTWPHRPLPARRLTCSYTCGLTHQLRATPPLINLRSTSKHVYTHTAYPSLRRTRTVSGHTTFTTSALRQQMAEADIPQQTVGWLILAQQQVGVLYVNV